uniref:FtsX-like permease family protein n=1 Tax=Prevotella sp. GTC17253 TaxID=3236793 RepID=A0AB33IW26_9BACT
MLKIIFKTLWNERSKNGWLAVELTLVGFFLFFIVYFALFQWPMFQSGKGYDNHHLYMVEFSRHTNQDEGWKPASANDSVYEQEVRHALQLVRGHEAVEECVAGTAESGLYGNNITATRFAVHADSARKISAQFFELLPMVGGDLLHLYRFRDAYTGQPIHLLRPGERGITAPHTVYISKYIAETTFPGQNPIGRQIRFDDERGSTFTVAGVFDDVHFQTMSVNDGSLMVFHNPNLDMKERWEGVRIMLRLREDADVGAFRQWFDTTVVPQLRTGNIYAVSLKSIVDLQKEQLETYGLMGAVRIAGIFTLFLLACIFLGTLGTFWLRMADRRDQIGVQKAMGADTRSIIKQYLLESGMLTTLSFLMALVLAASILQPMGMFHISPNQESLGAHYSYLMYHPVRLFCLSALITYAVLILISCLATLIPAKQAASELPSEALREL